MTRTGAFQLAEIAAGPGTVHERAQALLDELHPLVPFDGARMALAERGGTADSSVANGLPPARRTCPPRRATSGPGRGV